MGAGLKRARAAVRATQLRWDDMSGVHYLWLGTRWFATSTLTIHLDVEEVKMLDVECFWCEPLPIADVTLRRYHQHKHDASVFIGTCEWPLENPAAICDPNLRHYNIGMSVTPNDPRFPKKCSGCDYQFTASDDDTVNIDRRFRRVDTGEIFNHENPMPVGTMSWVPLAVGLTCGGTSVLSTDGDGDGRCVFVVIPCRPDFSSYHESVRRTIWWEIDHLTAGTDRRSEDMGRSWKRSGSPPKITVEKGIESWLGFKGNLIDGRLRGRLEP